MEDITDSNSASVPAAAEPQLVIPKRSIVVNHVSDDDEDTTPAENQQPLRTDTQKKIIAPEHSSDPEATVPETMTSDTPEPTAPPPENPPAPIEPAASIPEEQPAKPPEPDVPQPIPEAPKPKKPVDEAEVAKRQAELEATIEKHEYFLPISTVEQKQKRSINGSIILTIAVFILALVLLDLMLDSNAIYIVQRVPHTHFFGNSGN